MLNFYKIDDIDVEEWQTAVILEDKRQYYTVYKKGVKYFSKTK